MSDGPFRSTLHACPRCASRLVEDPPRRLGCEHCDGVWMPDADVREVVQAMAPDLDPAVERFTYATRETAAPLICPVCSDPLRPVRFGGVALDRCDKDGALWFDGTELVRVMEQIGADYALRRSTASDDPALYASQDRATWVPEPEGAVHADEGLAGDGSAGAEPVDATPAVARDSPRGFLARWFRRSRPPEP